MKAVAAFFALAVLSPSVPSPASAAQVCGCKKLTTGRVSKITAGAFPTCNLVSQALVCWPDTSTPGVTSITAGDGLQATPANPITSTGTIAIAAPTCLGTDKLTWTGTAFQCAPDQIGGGSYDSGWFPVSVLSNYVLSHDLNSTKVITQIYFGNTSDGSGIVTETHGTEWRDHNPQFDAGVTISALSSMQITIQVGKEMRIPNTSPGGGDNAVILTSGYVRVIMIALG